MNKKQIQDWLDDNQNNLIDSQTSFDGKTDAWKLNVYKLADKLMAVRFCNNQPSQIKNDYSPFEVKEEIITSIVYKKV